MHTPYLDLDPSAAAINSLLFRHLTLINVPRRIPPRPDLWHPSMVNPSADTLALNALPWDQTGINSRKRMNRGKNADQRFDPPDLASTAASADARMYASSPKILRYSPSATARARS